MGELFELSGEGDPEQRDRFAAETSATGAGGVGGVAPGMPLAARMRPRDLDEYVGQGHLLGAGRLLRRAVESDRYAALVFYGPPGVGKTTLAEIIARKTTHRFVRLSGVESAVADIRKQVEAAVRLRRMSGQETVLFVDEIHRFSKPQQDVLLPHIERGVVRFIGATTHNPYFSINGPLVSRAQIFQLEPLGEGDVIALLARAVKDEERGYGRRKVEVEEGAFGHLAAMCDGDARKALGALELAVETTEAGEDGVVRVTVEVAEESIQRKVIAYGEDGHYDTISAYIKSVRGCDPDAGLYWLAAMLEAGEDPRYIARRLVILASEDIGLADPLSLLVATAAQGAVETIGLPEARIALAHATVHLATAPKSNRAYAALGLAEADVRSGRSLAVPAHLRTATRKRLMKEGGMEGADTSYSYGHDVEGGYIPQAYLPEGRRYYSPSDNGAERRVAERLARWREEAKGGVR